MVTVMINGRTIQVPDGTTILEATRISGMAVPTLCYLKGINEIGACRVCVVEVEGIDHLVSSCNNICTDGMVIRTSTPRVREARRVNLQLLLSRHRVNCPTCSRSRTCQLREVVSTFTVEEFSDFKAEYDENRQDEDQPIIRDESKCIKCYRCVSFCDKVQSLNVWDMIGSGAQTSISVSHHRHMRESDCSQCGQCITHCPTNGLHTRDDTRLVNGVNGVLTDPRKTVVVQVAPAVRAAWGEEFGLPPEIATEKRIAAALRRVGFNYVFDTKFSADLTIMEEATEFLERLRNPRAHRWPMFTSCCPGWVRFLKSQYPDMVDQLSTAKSPQQMFGAVAKSYFAERVGVAPENLVSVSIMPCTAKKGEAAIPTVNDAKEGVRDVDIVLTTREMCRIIREDQINVAALTEEEFDSPLGTGTGAGVIFGSTGGVMEAALRTCHYLITGQNPDADETFRAVRASGSDRPWIEAEYTVGGITVRAAVVNGLGNARRLIRAIRRGETDLQFAEVMACPGGCVGGGGQPIRFNEERAARRAEVLYAYDKKSPLRFSHENPEVQKLYADYLGEPCGERAHRLLHTDHHAWTMPLAPSLDEDVQVRQ